LFLDEASVSVAPVLSRTWAPRGKTPCITVSTEVNARLYMASAVSEHGDLFFLIRKKPFDSAASIEFLEQIRKVSRRKLLVIWDGASIHNSEKIRNWLEKQPQSDYFLAQQPHYSPELNADEQVWHYLKGQKLKDTCNQNVNELKPKIEKAMLQLKQDKGRIAAFFRHPELGYY
jgi:transposase